MKQASERGRGSMRCLHKKTAMACMEQVTFQACSWLHMHPQIPRLAMAFSAVRTVYLASFTQNVQKEEYSSQRLTSSLNLCSNEAILSAHSAQDCSPQPRIRNAASTRANLFEVHSTSMLLRSADCPHRNDGGHCQYQYRQVPCHSGKPKDRGGSATDDASLKRKSVLGLYVWSGGNRCLVEGSAWLVLVLLHAGGWMGHCIALPLSIHDGRTV